MDITRSEKPVDEHSARLLDSTIRYKAAIKKLERFTLKDKDGNRRTTEQATYEMPKDFITAFEDADSRMESIADGIRSCEKEIQSAAVWGEFSKTDIAKIGSLGYEMHFFSVPSKHFDKEWENKYILQIVEQGENVWFVILVPQGENATFPAREIQPPSASVNELKDNLKELKEEFHRLEGRISTR